MTYDPLDYETWPEDQKDFEGRVWRGLHDGDLKPLAEYLRAGYYLDPALAIEIADAIDGKDVGFFHIVTKGRTRGEQGFTHTCDEHDRKMQIGVYMEERLRRYGRGGYAAALAETQDKFDIKSGETVAKALRYLRRHMAESQCAPDWDQWSHLRVFYSTP